MSNYHAGKLQQQKKQRFLLFLDQFISNSEVITLNLKYAFSVLHRSFNHENILLGSICHVCFFLFLINLNLSLTAYIYMLAIPNQLVINIAVLFNPATFCY